MVLGSKQGTEQVPMTWFAAGAQGSQLKPRMLTPSGEVGGGRTSPRRAASGRAATSTHTQSLTPQQASTESLSWLPCMYVRPKEKIVRCGISTASPSHPLFSRPSPIPSAIPKHIEAHRILLLENAASPDPSYHGPQTQTTTTSSSPSRCSPTFFRITCPCPQP